MKPIPRCDGYFADENGHVWSSLPIRRREAPIRRIGSTCTDNGYYVTCVVEDGKKRPVKIHRLVARAFHGERPAGLQVRHLDGNPLNNRPENLKYGTSQENYDDAVMHGRVKIRKPPPRKSGRCDAKLTAVDVQWLRAYALMGFSYKRLAYAFGANYQRVYLAITGQTWKWVPRLTTKGRFSKKQLTPEQILEVRDLAKAGMTTDAICARFCYTKSGIRNILLGLTKRSQRV